MNRSAFEDRQDHWRRVIAECNSSGICKTAWCRQNGISIKSFYYTGNVNSGMNQLSPGIRLLFRKQLVRRQVQVYPVQIPEPFLLT